MHRNVGIILTAVVGLIGLTVSLFVPVRSPFQQLAPESEATLVAAVATMAAAQSTIAAQVGSGAAPVSAAPPAGARAAAVTSAGAKGGYQPPVGGAVGGVIFYDSPAPESVEPGQPVFLETFDGGPQLGWIFLDNRWAVVDGALTMSDVGTEVESSLIAYLPVLVSGSYEVAFDLLWPGFSRYDFIGGHNQPFLAVRLGERRAKDHPYFKDSGLSDNGESFMRMEVKRGLYRDEAMPYSLSVGTISLGGQLPGAQFAEYSATRREYKDQSLLPGDHRIKFRVEGNRYLVDLDGAQIIEHVQLTKPKDDLPQSLYVEIAFRIYYEEDLADIWPFPSLDNIEIRLVE